MIIIKAKQKDNILNYLTVFEGLKYNKIQSLFRKKDVKVNGVRVKNDFCLNIDDEIVLYANFNDFFDIKTIYEDENVIIVDKPKKLETISQTKNLSLLNILNKNYYAVHRLDFNTEGLVVIAKNTQSKEVLDKAFKNHLIDKKYITICKNKPNKNKDTFIDFLEKKHKHVVIFNKKDNLNEKIITHIELLLEKENYSLIRVNIETGKTHQIRAHLAFHNLFVLGDEKYGDFKTNKNLNLKNQILKCIELKFNFEENCFLSYLNNKNFCSDYSHILTYFENLN